MWPDFTGVLNCRAHANSHIFLIRCIFNCCFECFHTAVSFCCLIRYWEESAQYIFTYSSKRRSGLGVCSSLKLHPGGLNYSLALQRHTGQTAVLQVLTLGHMRSNDYSTTKICRQFFVVDVVDNVNLSLQLYQDSLINSPWLVAQLISNQNILGPDEDQFLIS